MTVDKDKDSKDACQIWNKICECYDNIMSSKIRSQQLHQTINTVWLATANWKDSHQSFITNCVKHQHQCNLLQKQEDQTSNDMVVNMMNTALIGLPHLEDVLSNYFITRNDTGITDPFKITLAVCLFCFIATTQTCEACSCLWQQGFACVVPKSPTKECYTCTTVTSTMLKRLHSIGPGELSPIWSPLWKGSYPCHCLASVVLWGTGKSHCAVAL